SAMSSKPTESPLWSGTSPLAQTWSIAFQFVLIFTIAAGGLVLFTMLASYWFAIQRVNNDNDRDLADKLAAILADLAADSGPQSLSQELNIIHVADKIYAVRVLDSAGDILAESPEMSRILPVEIFRKALSTPGQRPVPVTYHAANREPFALVTAGTDLGNQRLPLQLAQTRPRDERFAGRYAALISVILCCVVLTCAGVAIAVPR